MLNAETAKNSARANKSTKPETGAPASDTCDRDLLIEAAKEELEDAGGDTQAAARALWERAQADRILRDPLFEPWGPRASLDLVSSLSRSRRQAIWSATNPRTVPRDNLSELAEAGVGLNLLDFPLPGGKRLADATSADVQVAAAFYREQADDMSAKADWLSAIAEKVKGKKTVSQVLSNAQLQELR